MWVAPGYRQDVATLMAAEAERRSTGWDLDPSAAVFAAWSEALRLAKQVKAMESRPEG